MKRSFFALFLVLFMSNQANSAVSISTAVSITQSNSSGTCVVIRTIGEPYSHANGHCYLEESGDIEDEVQFSGAALGYPCAIIICYKTWETLDLYIENEVPICSRFDNVVVGHVTDSNLNIPFANTHDCCTSPPPSGGRRSR
jgi:hypothetical protein